MHRRSKRATRGDRARLARRPGGTRIARTESSREEVWPHLHESNHVVREELANVADAEAVGLGDLARVNAQPAAVEALIELAELKVRVLGVMEGRDEREKGDFPNTYILQALGRASVAH